MILDFSLAIILIFLFFWSFYKILDWYYADEIKKIQQEDLDEEIIEDKK
jgi:hypothetical protein